MATQLFFRTTLVADTHLGTDNTNLRGTNLGWFGPSVLSTSRGSGVTNITTNTITGPTAGLEIGWDGTVQAYEFFSPPIAADVTISGTITLNIWAAESSMSANVAINAVIDVVRANTLTTRNSNTIVEIARSTRTTELAVTTRAVNNFTVTPTSTVVNRGDRLRVRIFGDDSAAATMATGFTFSVGTDGTTAAADGDTYVTFTENFSFESAPGVLDQSQRDSEGKLGEAAAGTRWGQAFVAQSTSLTEVRVWLSKTSTPTDDVILEIQGDSAGAPDGVSVGTVATVGGGTLTTTMTQYTYGSLSIGLTQGATYWLVYRRTGALNALSNYNIGYRLAAVSGWSNSYLYNGSSWASAGSLVVTVRLTFSAAPTTLYLTNTQSGLSAAPALISDFTGADENPLSEGGNWAILNSSTSALRRLSNAAVPSAASNSFSYWTPANFGPDVEAYVTLQTVAAAAAHRLFARIQGEGGAGTWDGYGIGATGGSANTFLLSVTNGTVTTLGATASASSVWASGDKLGIRCEGSTLQGWRLPNGGSNWELVVTAVDSTYPSAGKIGLNAQSTSAAFDNLYAATDSNLFTQKAWTSRGAGVVSYLSDTDAGWTAPLYTHDWYTPELAAFTLTGMAQANIRALESNASANASLRCELARVNSDGTSPTVWASWCCAPTGSDNGELTTSEVARTINVSGDDLAFTDGQRIRIRLYNEDISSAAMANAFNVQPFYNGTSGGASGDTYITLPQTVSEFGGGPTEFFHDPLRVMQAVNRSNVY